MKKYITSLLSVTTLTLLVSAPVSAAVVLNPATPATTSAPSPAITSCLNQLKVLARVSTDLDTFKTTYYVVPTDLTYYPVNSKAKNPVTGDPVQGSHYVGPNKALKGTVNYGLVSARFNSAYNYYSTLTLKNSTTLALNKANLASLKNHNAKVTSLINAQIGNPATPATPGKIDITKAAFAVPTGDTCNTAAGRKTVTNEIKSRNIAINGSQGLKQDLKKVQQATFASRKDYQTLEAQRAKLDKAGKL